MMIDSGGRARAPIRYLLRILFIGASLCGAAQATTAPLAAENTDANIVTAIDVSDSIGRHEEWLQQAGLARAIVHPNFLWAVSSARHRRIGFAVFTWSSNGSFDILVPWTIIGSSEDAARVSAALAAATLVDRSHYGGGDREDGDSVHAVPDRLTDVSAAIDFAADLLAAAPYAASQSVMNICADGSDNVGGGTELSRDRAVARGFTVNGLVLGGDADLAGYFRSRVIGGSDAFVMEYPDPDRAGEIMMEKLRRDLLISMSAQP